MPAGNIGHDGGIAARQSLSTHSWSAAAANGRFRQCTPAIIPSPRQAAERPVLQTQMVRQAALRTRTYRRIREHPDRMAAHRRACSGGASNQEDAP